MFTSGRGAMKITQLEGLATIAGVHARRMSYYFDSDAVLSLEKFYDLHNWQIWHARLHAIMIQSIFRKSLDA